jgi:uncharacterized protein YjbI with pentapeptide repeats
MAIHSIHRRWKTRPFAMVEADGPAQALERTVRSGADLTYADLRGLVAPGCFLPGADLRGADFSAADLTNGYLRGADLRSSAFLGARLAYASMRQADLSKADLRDADMRRADLRDARFAGADLRGVRLTGARLEGALIDWRWSAFPVELLRRDADCRGDAFRAVAALAFDDDDRPFGWLRALVKRTDVLDWAFDVLGRAILKGDGAPEMLRRLSADVDVEADALAPAVETGSQLFWTRRAPR